MEEDGKLTNLNLFFKLAFSMPRANMYFVMPGGLLTGHPITREEYFQIMYEDSELEVPEPADVPELQRRFFFLEDVIFISGSSTSHFNTTIIDGREVGAWGFYDPENSFNM